MRFNENFLSIFFHNYTLINEYENDVEYYCQLTSITYTPTIRDNLDNNQFDFLQPSDHLSYTISFGEADPISFYSSNPNLIDFKTKLDSEYIHQEGEEIKVTFKINKNKFEDCISIYDLDLFADSLEKLTVSQSFTIFNRVLLGSDFINFRVLNLEKSFNTSSIFFTPIGENVIIHALSDRLKRIESIRAASYYTNINDHQITPDDFKISNGFSSNSKLSLLFTNYSDLLSIIYLFDITTIKDNVLEYKINGYKSIKGQVELNSKIKSIEDYFNIYSWVYSGGNLNDKIGIARNIISLHFIKNGELGLHGSPFQSIQSSYKVYEKQNIKQYIEIRNKISDQLLDFNNRANKVIETFASGFQKSALALISFYTSAIVVRLLSKGDFINVFTLDATILSISFIIGSYIYYKTSKWEVLQQRQRFNDSYTNLKERYTDLLEASDIERILNKDKEFNADIKFIDDKLKNYSIMWLSYLWILLIVTILLFLTYNISKLTDTAIWHLLFSKNCNC